MPLFPRPFFFHAAICKLVCLFIPSIVPKQVGEEKELPIYLLMECLLDHRESRCCVSDVR